VPLQRAPPGLADVIEIFVGAVERASILDQPERQAARIGRQTSVAPGILQRHQRAQIVRHHLREPQLQPLACGVAFELLRLFGAD